MERCDGNRYEDWGCDCDDEWEEQGQTPLSSLSPRPLPRDAPFSQIVRSLLAWEPSKRTSAGTVANDASWTRSPKAGPPDVVSPASKPEREAAPAAAPLLLEAWALLKGACGLGAACGAASGRSHPSPHWSGTPWAIRCQRRTAANWHDNADQ